MALDSVGGDPSASGRVLVPRGTFWRLLRYLLPRWPRLIVALGALGAATAADVLQPIMVKIFLDRYLIPRHFPRGPLIALALGYVGLIGLTALFAAVQLLLFEVLALDVVQRLRVDLFDTIQRLPLAYFDRTPVGVLVSRVTNDTEAILEMFMSVLAAFIQNVALLMGVILAMLALDARLALVMLILFPVFGAIMWLYQRVSSPLFYLARHRLSLLNAKLNESLQGMALIQHMRQVVRWREDFHAINDAYRAVRYRNTQVNGVLLRPLTEVVYLLTLMAVLAYFGTHSLTAAVNIGVLYAFVSYLSRFFEPVNNILQRLNSYQQAMVSAARVFHILDDRGSRPMPVGADHPKIIAGEVRFEDVSFAYDGEHDVLRHVSFTVKSGQTVALVGHTGSGKSTAMNLLLRFYPLDRGRIIIDGHDLRTFDEEELRQKIALVLQEPFLFVGDVASNIRLGTKSLDEAAVHRAAHLVQLDRFLSQWPLGYRTPVGERGATLSTGQRQLISFARAMARDPVILVLDEATASVDTETEAAIQRALANMRQGRTTIIIAHRLSTIQDADIILVFHRGEVVERGTHQELLRRKGLYHAMYQLQSGERTATPPASV
ncbi:MAG: ABC transporter transmembrane domain-containing protein [Firmicutes bacterium]|nr:ABC transporter transmembrane domain-containing protein [Bacillota bacterium]